MGKLQKALKIVGVALGVGLMTGILVIVELESRRWIDENCEDGFRSGLACFGGQQSGDKTATTKP